MPLNERPSTAAVIVAAGRGTRIGSPENGPKQYLSLGQHSILQESVARFLAHPAIDLVQVVIHLDDNEQYHNAVSPHTGLLPPAIGGATRQDSCRLGLEALADQNIGHVLIHDAARPFLAADTITSTLDAIKPGYCVLPAIAISDTIKRAAATGDQTLAVTETLDRDGLYLAQTPQGFVYSEILDAHRRAFAADIHGLTDDAAVAEWAGMTVSLSAGNPDNFKITTANDLERARQMTANEIRTALPDIRTGIGYDIHRLVPGDGVWLCGIKIEGPWRLDGHSDADVALHALTDALLGTIGEGDIGSHFPPSDPKWRGASSDQFLEHACKLVREFGATIMNLDLTIICEAPKIGPHREAMRQQIAAICGIEKTRVSVKATTNETIGAVGRKEGIAAMATATVGFAP